MNYNPWEPYIQSELVHLSAEIHFTKAFFPLLSSIKGTQLRRKKRLPRGKTGVDRRRL
jgi:hypothetical protein